MVPIPARADLTEMLRAEIQQLCKDNNIKANMRTEDMIDALCVLASSKDKSRTQRAASSRNVSRTSRPPSRTASKSQDAASHKKARQVSEQKTDVESVADTPPTAPTTRRKAKEIQIHLGKGRPAIAGGNGARAITKRKSKASAAIARRQETIPEEDEEHVASKNATAVADNADTAAPSHPTSPAQLPTPAPSHPSHSLPSAHQIAALEVRLAQLEAAASARSTTPSLNSDPVLQERLNELEASTARIATLQAAIAPISAIEARMEAAAQHAARLEADLTQRNTRLEAEFERLVAENVVLRERVSTLEARLQTQDSHDDGASDDKTNDAVIALPATPVASSSMRGKRVGSMIIRSPGPEETHKETIQERPGTPRAPSPAQPTLGKRTRRETFDTDASAEAIDRVVRPMRKRARLNSGREDVPFSSSIGQFHRMQGGPSSTSTPRVENPDSPSGFFTVGRRPPTPLARRKDDMDVADVEVDLDAYINLGDEPEEAAAGPSSAPADSPEASTQRRKTPNAGFFGSPLPVLFAPGSALPYPLNPSTPPPGPIPETYTPRALGAPWQHAPTPTPTQEPHTPGSVMHAPTLLHTPVHDLPGYTFRGGRRERNDRYNPYFTPGTRHRTGLTPPPPPLASALGSPAKVEGAGGGDETEEAVAPLRTLYGTELEGDTRFGDFGANLGRFNWSKYAR